MQGIGIRSTHFTASLYTDQENQLLSLPFLCVPEVRSGPQSPVTNLATTADTKLHEKIDKVNSEALVYD